MRAGLGISGLSVAGGESAPPPPAEDTIQSLGMFGGQWKIQDTDKEVAFLDLMDRVRCPAIIPAGSGFGNYGFSHLSVQSLVRSANVVTVTLTDEPGLVPGTFYLITGQEIVLHCLPDDTFSVEGVQITVTDQTHFTYPCTGANGTAPIAAPTDVPAAVMGRVQLGAGGHPIEDHRLILSNAASANDDVDGTYTVNFIGAAPGSVSFTGCTTSGYSPGADSFQITVTSSTLLVLVMNSVPADGSYLGVRIIPQGEDQTGATKLRTDFAANCARGKYTRWMDALLTNGNAVHKSWAQRPVANLGTGLPYETLIDTCNELSHHAWFTIPTFAADDYVTGLATLAEDRLSASLDAVYEYTNEPWNSALGFTQFQWLFAMSKADVLGIYHGYEDYAEIATLSKASGTATVVLNHDLPPEYITGLHIDAVMTDNDFDATDVAITVTGADTFTYPVSAGTESASSLNGAFFGNLTSNLLSGGERNVYSIRERYIARKAYLQSQLVKAAYGGTLNGLAKYVFMWQCTGHGFGSAMANNILPWLEDTYGAIGDWCYAIGGAPYPRGSGTTTANLRDAVIAEMDDLYTPSLHSIRYLATKYGIPKVWCYEGGVDLVGVNVARTDSMFTSADMRTAQEHVLSSVYAAGTDLFMSYTTGTREVGTDGSSSWGLGEYNADLLPVGSATAPKAQGVDDVILIAPPAIADANQLPGTVTLMNVGANTLDSDDAAGYFLLNGYAALGSADAFVEKLFYAPAAGTLNVTIYGKHSAEFGSSNNALRVYLDGVLEGAHALFDNGSDVTVGTAGGYASPTTFALDVPTAGWHILRLRGPAGAQPDRIGVSRVAA
jgi:hypothetical protein